MRDDEGRLADRRFLGLELDATSGRGTVVVTERLMTAGGRFYGGAGVSLAGAAMEAVTGRRLRWVTVQFVSSAGAGATIELTAEVAAQGRTTAQVHVVARVGAATLFHALGSTDTAPTDVPGAVLPVMPAAPDPEDCAELRLPFPRSDSPRGQFVVSELRDAGSGESPGMRAWARVRGHDASRPAMLGYIADYVPISIMRAMGVRGAGTSIDNTIRVGAPPAAPPAWVLVDLRPELSAGGYGHGRANLWSPAGELLGIASQTARLFQF